MAQKPETNRELISRLIHVGRKLSRSLLPEHRKRIERQLQHDVPFAPVPRPKFQRGRVGVFRPTMQIVNRGG